MPTKEEQARQERNDRVEGGRGGRRPSRVRRDPIPVVIVRVAVRKVPGGSRPYPIRGLHQASQVDVGDVKRPLQVSVGVPKVSVGLSREKAEVPSPDGVVATRSGHIVSI